MPWLAGTALLHSALVMEKRDALKVWTVLLAIITFSLSLMGTFLVRSGVLDLGARLRRRSGARHLHPRHPGACSSAARSRCSPGARRSSRRAGCSRRSAARARSSSTISCSTTACADRARRHALSAGARGPDRRQDLGRRAVLQSHLRAADRAAALIAVPFGPLLAWKRGDLLAAAQRLMAALRGACGDHCVLAFIDGGRRSRAARHRARHLADRRRAHRSCYRVKLVEAGSSDDRGAGCAACRARPSARRWRMQASG